MSLSADLTRKLQNHFSDPTIENSVPYMYLDTKGIVTIGIGHVIRNADDAAKLNFVIRGGSIPVKVQPEVIKGEYEKISKLPKGHLYTFYHQKPSFEIDTPVIRALFQADILRFYRALLGLFSKFDDFPEPAQIGLFDMIYNVGQGKLQHQFVKFNQAVISQQWSEAAKQCHRKGIQTSRNQYVKGLFTDAASSTKPQIFGEQTPIGTVV